MVKYEVTATDEKIAQLKEETTKDPVLQKLKKIINEGWPNNSKTLDNEIKFFYPHKSDLCIVKDLIYKGNCIVIPESMTKEMLNRIHYNHLGIFKCTKMAQESIFWPQMTKQINDKIDSNLCLQFANSQNRKPLKNHEVLSPMEQGWV